MAKPSTKLRRPTVLVTGFGPFPGAPENPSQILVGELGRAAADWQRDADLHAAVLPTRYDAARETALRLHRRLRPDIAIHFGFSLKANGFTLELLAENRLSPGRLDAGGARPARTIIRAGGPQVCPSTLPLHAIASALVRRGLPAVYSEDAGAYVCNLVFYLAAAPGHGRFTPAMAGFVHVPLLSEMAIRPGQRARAGRALVRMSRAEVVEGGKLIVDSCLSEWRRRRSEV